MNKKRFKKTEAIVWKHFTRHGDAVFLSLGKEIRIGVLSVATLAAACPDSAVAQMAMSQHRPAEEETALAAASSGGEDEPLDLSVLQNGDLLFSVASPSRNGIAQAIVSVTEGVDLQQVSHVAIVCKETDGRFYALEASGRHGVWLTPVDSFFVHSDTSPEGRPMVLLGRLKDPSCAAASVERAKAYLGRPYDYQYGASDSAVYCSELVHLAYLDANGEELFPQQPMSFHDRTGQVTQFWKDYYRRWNMAVPEGEPGTNPGAISRSDKIDIIGKFF